MYPISCSHPNAQRPFLCSWLQCRERCVLPLLSHPGKVPGLASTVEDPQWVIGVWPGSAPAVPSAVGDHGLSHICGHVTSLEGTGGENHDARSVFKSVTSLPAQRESQGKEVKVLKESDRSGRRKSKIMKMATKCTKQCGNSSTWGERSQNATKWRRTFQKPTWNHRTHWVKDNVKYHVKSVAHEQWGHWGQVPLSY